MCRQDHTYNSNCHKLAAASANTTNEMDPSPPPPPPPAGAAAATDDQATIDRKKASFEYTKSVLLGKRVKATLSDGRTLTGIFICIDRLKNLILTNVIEERLVDPADYTYRHRHEDDGNNGAGGSTASPTRTDTTTTTAGGGGRLRKVERRISQAMIPGSRLVRVEIAKSLLRCE